MSDRGTPPLGITILVVLGGIDGLWHVLAGILRILGGLLDPLALLVGAVTLVIGLGQLAVLSGLWNMEAWGWRWTVRILGFVVALDVFALLLGQGGLFRLVLTLGVLGYVYAQKSRYVGRSRSYV